MDFQAIQLLIWTLCKSVAAHIATCVRHDDYLMDLLLHISAHPYLTLESALTIFRV